MSRETITERDLSFHEATAGIAARDEASKSGGDPAQLRALVHASRATDTAPLIAPGSPMLKGLRLRDDDLLVEMCLLMYKKVFGADPREQLKTAIGEGGSLDQRIVHRQAIAALALIFAQPDTAYDLLDRASDPEVPKEEATGWARDFRRSAVEFAGNFGATEISILGDHVIRLSRHQSAAQEDGPGK